MEKEIEIGIIKLNNGDELIGELIAVTDQTVTMREPYQVGYRVTDSSLAPTIGLTKYILISEEQDLTFPLDEVTIITTPRPVFAQYYLKARNSYEVLVKPYIDRIIQQALGSDEEQLTMDRQYAQALANWDVTGLEKQ